MDAFIVLKWTYSPSDYFGEAIEIPRQDYMMRIADGQAHAKIDSGVYETSPDMQQKVHSDLNSRFLAASLYSDRPYELSCSTMSSEYPDGRRGYLFEPEPGCFGISGEGADFRITSKDGTVIADSRRKRMENEERLAQFIRSDDVMAKLLESHSAARRDPNNELAHLYEIRDALSTKFDGQAAALTALDFKRAKWSDFGRLCNVAPLRQGRHGGKAEVLRDDTRDELIEARGIAKDMIEAYLQYLGRRAGLK